MMGRTKELVRLFTGKPGDLRGLQPGADFVGLLDLFLDGRRQNGRQAEPQMDGRGEPFVKL